MRKKNLIFLTGILVFCLFLVGVYVYAQGEVSHEASEIKPGDFQTGTYSFRGQSTFADEIGIIRVLNSQDVNKRLMIGYDNASNYGYISALHSGSSWRPLILQGTKADGANVGIGTTSPSQKLDVSGNILGSNLSTAGSVTGAIFYDNDDAEYYVNPAGTTRISTVYPNKIIMDNNQHIYNSGNQRGNAKGNWYYWIDSDNNDDHAKFIFAANHDSFNPPTKTLMEIWDSDRSVRAGHFIADGSVSSNNVYTNLLFTYNHNCPSGWTCHIRTWDIAAQSIKYYGSLSGPSSIKHKKNLKVYDGSFLNRISGIKAYQYQLKKEDPNSKEHFGYLAEELPKEILDKDGDVDMMSYNGMLLKLIQEQQREIENLEKRIEELEKGKVATEESSFWARILGR